jgi:Flp pilus assembly protein TadG
MKKTIGLRWREFWAADDGVTAIEFAIVGPPFLLLIGMILETGLMLFTEYALQNSVQEASRSIRTGAAQTGAYNTAKFKTEICKFAKALPNCNAKLSVDVKNATKFSTLNLPSYLNVGTKNDGTMNPSTFSCGGPSEAVGVIATYDWTFTLPSYLGNVNGGKARRLSGVAVFRNEPFPAGTTCS